MGAAAVVAGAVGASAIAGVAGSAMTSSAAKSAASQQAAAELQAANLQEGQYQQTYQALQPYNVAGQGNLAALQALPGTANTALTGAYNAAQAQLPGPMTQAQLVQTPGYQFNLSQGLQATQNANAARGLGVSGAALKEGATYATGLANSTYAQQLQNQQTIYNAYNQQFSNMYNQQGQQYNMLYGPAALGESAAANAGTIGQQGAAAAGSNIAGAGAAQAAGTTASANALAQGLNSLGSAPMQYLALNQLLGNNGAGGIYSSSLPSAGAVLGTTGNGSIIQG